MGVAGLNAAVPVYCEVPVPRLADPVRSTSLYRRLDRDVGELLLDAIAERIRTRMADRVSRRYLSVLRVGERTG